MFFQRPFRMPATRFVVALGVPLLVAIVTLAMVAAQAAGDCTAFAVKAGESLVYGRNMDYDYEHGLILVNKRHVSKSAFLLPLTVGSTKPARWTSRYGSVTVSNIGREFPDTGMNEVGLVVCETTLEQSRYPDTDEREAINVAQWIQYQLDKSATVKEVLASLDAVRIFPPGKRGHHYFMCDASGDCATVEYLDGRAVVHHGEGLPVTVLTNDTYHASTAFLGEHVGFGGAASIPQDNSSLARFVRAANLLRTYHDESKLVDYAFRVLTAVAQGEDTKRSIVFDIAAKRLHFRTLSHPAVKFINLADVDYGCASPMQILDTKQPGQGDISDKLEIYTDQAHAHFMRTVLNDNLEIKQIVADPAAFVDEMTRYYATFKCDQRTVGQRDSRSRGSGDTPD